MIHICKHKFKPGKDGKLTFDLPEPPKHLDLNYQTITAMIKSAQYIGMFDGVDMSCQMICNKRVRL